VRTGATRSLSVAGALLAVICTVALLAGCGNTRTPVPDVRAPAAATTVTGGGFPRVGISFFYPSNWQLTPTPLPLDVTISSGSAVIALWRFPRTGPAPRGRPALALARDRLVAAARTKDRALILIRSKVTRVDRTPAIVVDTIQRIDGAKRRVRSLHIFAPGREIVLEEYTPPADFHAVDHDVFSPLNRSIVVRRSPTRTS
jgi:hypothetical protein